jgi:hypothetical protein
MQESDRTVCCKPTVSKKAFEFESWYPAPSCFQLLELCGSSILSAEDTGKMFVL